MSAMHNPSRGLAAAAFIARWQDRAGSERANALIFVGELCARLGVSLPDPSHGDKRNNASVFGRQITFAHGDATNSAGSTCLPRTRNCCPAPPMGRRLRRPAGRGRGRVRSR